MPENEAVTPLPFRPPVHPGQSDTLVHFCGRGRRSASIDVAHLSAPERLDSILRDGALRASATFGWSTWPVACFSESDSGGVEAMLSIAGWEPWGLVVRRDWAWAQGGGPVWYVREDMMAAVADALDDRTRSWLVRTDPGQADWLHEREWRVPCADPGRPFVDLADAVVAILVGNPEWEPGLIHGIDMSPLDGDLVHVEQTPRLGLVPRWWWDGTRIRVLAPIEMRAEYHEPL